MIHNLLPNRDAGLDHLRRRLHPRPSPAAAEDHAGPHALDGRRRTARPTRCSTSTGAAGARRALTPTPTTRPAPTPAGRPRNTQVDPRATACWWRRPGTCTPAASTPTSSSRATAAPVNLFRSRAHYYEPAGAVSWDVAMTATRADWRVAVKRGDVLSVSATYDSKRASWYESMGIIRSRSRPARPGGVDPFAGKLDRHGQAHARAPARERQPRRPSPAACPTRASSPPSGRWRRPARDRRLRLRPGRPAARRRRLAPAVVAPGQTLTFDNLDAARHDLAHDHRLQGALQPHDRHRLPARRRRRSTSTPASSATGPRASRPPPTATRGRRRATSARAPTPTSAASTRSCGALPRQAADLMRVAVLGTGIMGAPMARNLAAAGHEVPRLEPLGRRRRKGSRASTVGRLRRRGGARTPRS